MDKYQEAAKRLKERTAGREWKPKEGNNVFRVLPNKTDPKIREYTEIGMHYKVGQQRNTLRCGKNLNNPDKAAPCYLCDKVIPKLLNSNSESKRELATNIAQKPNFYVQVLYREDGAWQGPKLWRVPDGVANNLLGLLSNEEAPVSSLKRGYNCTIFRTGEGLKTKYQSVLRSEKSTAIPPEIAAKAKTFAELLPKYSEEKMKEAWTGAPVDDEEVETDEDVNEDVEEEVEEEVVEDADEGDEADEAENDERILNKLNRRRQSEDEGDEPSEDDEDVQELGEDEEPDEDESSTEDEAEPEPDEEEEPVHAKKPAAKATAKPKAKPRVEEEDEGSEDYADEDEPTPAKKPAKVQKPAAKPAAKPVKKPARPAASDDDDE